MLFNLAQYLMAARPGTANMMEAARGGPAPNFDQSFGDINAMNASNSGDAGELVKKYLASRAASTMGPQAPTPAPAAPTNTPPSETVTSGPSYGPIGQAPWADWGKPWSGMLDALSERGAGNNPGLIPMFVNLADRGFRGT